MSEFPHGRGRWSDRAKTALAVVSVPLLGLVAAAAGPSAAAQRAVAAVPANQAATSAVALAAESGGFDDAFYRGQDGAVYQRTFRDGAWSAQTSIGGKTVGAPAAALAGTTLVVAARGTDGALWVRMRDAGTWGPWRGLGGTVSAGPAVTGDAAGRVDVFVRGGDSRLYTLTLPAGGSWSPWTGSPPAHVSSR